jgi:glycosyltransferase involved in cell wall biosynthesis
LVDFFCRFKSRNPSDLQLVLLGDGAIKIPSEHRNDVRDLGFVPAQDKRNGLAAALALCQPSVNESFSLALMESWLLRTPVLVHESCAVTREHCLASSGGLYFTSFEEFSGCLEYFLEHDDARTRMGWNGRAYVLANYTWSRVVQKYLTALRAWGFAL